MNRLLKVLKGEPVALTGLATAVVAVLAAVGVDNAVLAALSGLVTALIVFARALVTPVGNAKEVATQAAAVAATHAVTALGTDTVGEVGTILPEATSVVTGAIGAATATVNAALGGK